MSDKTFEEWYDKTYPETVNKHDGENVAFRTCAAYSWKASGEWHVKRVLNICEKAYKFQYEQHSRTEAKVLKNLIDEIKKEFNMLTDEEIWGEDT